MKIESGRGVNGAGGAKRASATAATPGFNVTIDAPQRTAPAGAAQAVTPLDALLALQGDEGPRQRRARQTRRGRDALDALEALERGLLLGRAPGALRGELERLRDEAEMTGDPGLDGVLQEIDVRVAVELAKLDRLQGRV